MFKSRTLFYTAIANYFIATVSLPVAVLLHGRGSSLSPHTPWILIAVIVICASVLLYLSTTQKDVELANLEHSPHKKEKYYRIAIQLTYQYLAVPGLWGMAFFSKQMLLYGPQNTKSVMLFLNESATSVFYGGLSTVSWGLLYFIVRYLAFSFKRPAWFYSK